MTRKQVKKKIRDGLNLSDDKLAAVLGVSSAMVSRWLNGKSVSARLDVEVARMLGVPLDEMPGRKKVA